MFRNQTEVIIELGLLENKFTNVNNNDSRLVKCISNFRVAVTFKPIFLFT